jgi:phosphonate transport system permease protein
VTATPVAQPGSRFLTGGGRVTIFVGAALVWAVAQAGVGGELVNGGGWPSFTSFWRAAIRPELGWEFVQLTVDAAAITMAYAILGTALSLVLGLFGALTLSRLFTGGGIHWWISRALLAVPRSIHEIIWALLLLQVFGFDPLVAVLAIALPFGAVTAKVFAETIDSTDPAPFRYLRASGARRLTALMYGIAPAVRGELLSYSFYRLECAIRSAAVLGVIGAGGLGFQLDLSFETLRYNEIWTLIAALMILSGLGDGWSTLVRRSTEAQLGRMSLLAVAVLVPLSWWWVDIDVTSVWSPRRRSLAVDFATDLFPARLGAGGWSELLQASADTVAMSILGILAAAVGGLFFGALASRPTGKSARPTRAGGGGRLMLRLSLLLFRAVPAPIWAFLMVLILFPGLWPGAVALGIYNLGVLGRLFAETLEDADRRPSDALVIAGATSLTAFFYATLPTAGTRLTALAFYRWEVIARETVVVGVVGAGGLGQLMSSHLAGRNFAAVTGVVGALVVISIVIDLASTTVRRALP